MWLATVIGLACGIVSSNYVGRVWLPRAIASSSNRLLAAKLALAGCLVSLLPALLLSIVAGGTFGKLWGERLLMSRGLSESGAVLGSTLGVAIVFAMILIGGTLGGIGVARGVGRLQRNK